MTCVFMRRRKFGLRHTQKQNNVDNVKIQRRQRPCEDEGRDWNYAVESHETPTVTRRWMKKGRIDLLRALLESGILVISPKCVLW